jgi:hypothetical protein
MAVRARAFGLCITCAACGDKAADAKSAEDAIRRQIAKYTAALDAADINLTSQVWRTSPAVTP